MLFAAAIETAAILLAGFGFLHAVPHAGPDLFASGAPAVDLLAERHAHLRACLSDLNDGAGPAAACAGILAAAAVLLPGTTNSIGASLAAARSVL